ncbi:MAG: PRC-barrel domain-containing protein [Methanobacteriaceae archaeon]
MHFIKDLSGKEAVDEAGNIVGKIVDIEIDRNLKRVESILLKEAKFSFSLGAHEKVISVNKIKAMGDKVLIDGIFKLKGKDTSKKLIK